MIKLYLNSLWDTAMERNKANIQKQLLMARGSEDPWFADFGCDDGVWTSRLGNTLRARKTTGIDIIASRLQEASGRGIETIEANLNESLPIEDDRFDLIHANQVIEHVADVDLFAKEVMRTLKPGGHAVISTENASSWCNVAAVAMGWQMFSLTNMSGLRSGIGNPLALHRGEKLELSSWTHKTLFSYLGLKEFFEVHGFVVQSLLGAGYFPLPSVLGDWDPRHAHFLSILVMKPDP